MDAVLLHGDVAGRPTRGVLDAPGRSANRTQVLVEHVAGDDRAVAQVWVCRDKGRGEDGPEAVAHVHDLLGLGAECAAARHRRQLSQDLQLVLCLYDPVCVRVVGLSRAQPVIREDRVAGFQRGVDVRVALQLRVPIPPIIVSTVRGDLEHVAASLGSADLPVDVVCAGDGRVLEHGFRHRLVTPCVEVDGPCSGVDVVVHAWDVEEEPVRFSSHGHV